MTDLAGADGLWAQRLAGSSAGAAVSLIYMLPKSKREAASRFFTGLSCGLVFGGPAGLWLAQTLALSEVLSSAEIMLSGSALASLGAWWGLGILSRIATRYARPADAPKDGADFGEKSDET